MDTEREISRDLRYEMGSGEGRRAVPVILLREQMKYLSAGGETLILGAGS